MGDHETYLKTQQLADALGVSPSSVKRWVDKGRIEATKTMGNHRLVTLSSALKFARARKYPTDNLLALSSHPAVVASDVGVADALLEALRAGDGREVLMILRSAYRSDRDAVALADHLIRPVMERIGHLWMVGGWDVYQEHQAVQILRNGLVDLIEKVSGESPSGRPLALGSTPEGDLYVLPLMLGELVLREGGWDVRNLGSDLPFRSLASAIRTYRPRLVFVSASTIIDKARFVQEYSYFYEAASQVGAAIILGGRGFDPDLRSRLVYASFGERMAHLAEFARRLNPATDAGSSLANIDTEPTDLSN